jgi:Mg2+/Co2+ transporter CorB
MEGTMTIKDQLEQRAKNRNFCRAAADKILALILKELDSVPESNQGQVLQMVQSELQIASRKEEKIRELRTVD